MTFNAGKKQTSSIDVYSRVRIQDFTSIFIATRISICANHLRANSSSVNRLAEMRARFLTARGFGNESAFSNP
jgi:hypothetical protein